LSWSTLSFSRSGHHRGPVALGLLLVGPVEHHPLREERQQDDDDDGEGGALEEAVHLAEAFPSDTAALEAAKPSLTIARGSGSAGASDRRSEGLETAL
jgi:hypothetical protein